MRWRVLSPVRGEKGRRGQHVNAVAKGGGEVPSPQRSRRMQRNEVGARHRGGELNPRPHGLGQVSGHAWVGSEGVRHCRGYGATPRRRHIRHWLRGGVMGACTSAGARHVEPACQRGRDDHLRGEEEVGRGAMRH